jgi:FK506-binding nuclear protein
VGEDSDDDDDEYDLDPHEEGLLVGNSDEEDDDISDVSSDELDDIEGPRVEEVHSDDDGEEAPKLVEAPASKKDKSKKRKAEHEPEGLDEMIAKAENKPTGQAKKLKNNKGEAVAAAEETKPALKNGSKGGEKDKKVQFAKELEQGPTGSTSKEKAAKDNAAPKSTVKVVQGVTIDDRKTAPGRTVKNGDKVGVRYIGKLKDGLVFDCKYLSVIDDQAHKDLMLTAISAKKSGAPFRFTVGKGEVIKGWDVGILGMGIGGERRLTIPPNMGYGKKTTGQIPANSTLTFDIKLMEIK